MYGPGFDELSFFRDIGASGARALLIGRRALVALGLPVMTADYDFWLHRDDVETFNAVAAEYDLFTNRTVEEIRGRGRYVLENDERVDVVVARRIAGPGGTLEFDEVWPRRETLRLSDDVSIAIPCLDDLIASKRLAGRPKDAEDVRLLETLREEGT